MVDNEFKWAATHLGYKQNTLPLQLQERYEAGEKIATRNNLWQRHCDHETIYKYKYTKLPLF